MASNRSADAASVANRFGLGARPGEIDRMHAPREALAAQLHKPPSIPAAFKGVPATMDYLQSQFGYSVHKRELGLAMKTQAKADGVALKKKPRDREL
ncbi:MAG: hypothetical protein ABIQ97_04915, partial [Lysobacteraceae bacterium]